MTASLGDASAAPPAEAAPKPNTLQRIAGVLMSPAQTFEDVARRPDVGFPATYREAFESANMPPQQMERSIRIAAAFGKTIVYFGPMLQVIAFAVISRLSRVRSAAIVISLWLVVVLFKVGGAAIGAARMQK
jgi:hypothetical protein